MGKEENAGYQQCFQKISFSGPLKGFFLKVNKSWDCVVKS